MRPLVRRGRAVRQGCQGDRARRRANGAFGRTRGRGKRETSTAGPPHEVECEAERAGSAGELRAPPSRGCTSPLATRRRRATSQAAAPRDECASAAGIAAEARTRLAVGGGVSTFVSASTPRSGAARTLPRYCRRQHLGSRADPRPAGGDISLDHKKPRDPLVIRGL